jgi:diguanylate cyclase (GGDEF)-like protein
MWWGIMQLDVLTLVAMGSFVAACAGVVLLLAWSQNRRTSTLAFWGWANIVNAAGIASLMLASALREPACALLGVALLALAPGLMWKAARSFEGKPAPVMLAFFGAAVVGLASGFAGIRAAAGALNLAFGAVYLLATVLAFWTGRKERLKARWPIIVLTVLHATVLVVGLYSNLDGSLAPGEIPPIMSLFGFIHFESIIFTLGTAVFIIALVKERSEAVSETAARIDPLTGVANRAAFMDNAGQVLEWCRRQNSPVSVIMCDLDRFKAVNDTHGHAIGDTVIQKFSQTATDALWPNDVLGRIGGEEFAIVLSGASIEAAYARAERIRVSFAESCCFVEGHYVGATVSCGLSVSAKAQHSLSELLSHSDLALYRAKAEGRNRVQRADQPKSASGEAAVVRVA